MEQPELAIEHNKTNQMASVFFTVALGQGICGQENQKNSIVIRLNLVFLKNTAY